MDSDEQAICNYLKQCPDQFFSTREICRRAAGKHRFEEEPYWAHQPLLRLVDLKMIETDQSGHFRYGTGQPLKVSVGTKGQKL